MLKLTQGSTSVPNGAKNALHERYFGHEHVTMIDPGGRWLDLRELWAYRELLVVLARRDIKVRYKQTALGAAGPSCSRS